ncbi:hypothetical protein [Bowmanella pacifica]|uniref:Uncharacterized protein n=1 Tax=Bowmanella pacifica TaxID=502051 RepID=A0A918DGE8_9ALTE|nr:hypothetical protein [Bowmanella pacifica]GGO64652.1 hypothetical protein GCM10010982_04590 [Bowmanella pacifica]
MQQDHQEIAQALKRFLLTVLAISSASLSLMIACMWLWEQERDRRASDSQYISSDDQFNAAVYQERCDENSQLPKHSSAISRSDRLLHLLGDDAFINGDLSTATTDYYWKNGYSIETSSVGLVARLEIQ